MIEPSKRCSKRVMPAGEYHSHQCHRLGVLKEEGALWCKQHAPSSEKARRQKSEAKWRAQSDARNLQWKLEDLRNKIADAALDRFGDSNAGGKLEQLVVQYKNLKRKQEQGGEHES